MRRASRAGGLRGEAGTVVRCIDSNTPPFLRHPSLGLTFATACTPASVREATTGFVNPPLPNTRARPSPSAACADSDPGWACHPQNASPRYCTQHKYLLHIGGRGAPTARLGRAPCRSGAPVSTAACFSSAAVAPAAQPPGPRSLWAPGAPQPRSGTMVVGKAIPLAAVAVVMVAGGALMAALYPAEFAASRQASFRPRAASILKIADRSFAATLAAFQQATAGLRVRRVAASWARRELVGLPSTTVGPSSRRLRRGRLAR